MNDTVKSVTDFEDETGIPGKEAIRAILTNSADPVPEIKQFQLNNRIVFPSLPAMLPLLDLHGVPRLDFNTAVMEDLRDKLIRRIEEISSQVDTASKEERDRMLATLLHKAFPLIKVPTIQPVVMTLLKSVHVLEDKYLAALVEDKSLYELCDVKVKRQIWQEHHNLFGDEVAPLLLTYIKQIELIFSQLSDPSPTFFLLPPRVRRQNSVLQSLSEMIGTNVHLYDSICQFLRSIFVQTANPHYCSLRVSLLMELHDANVTDITALDPVHKFVWCLDASIRENTLEGKRMGQLEGILDGRGKGSSVLAEIGMALADPYAVHFIAQSIVRTVQHQISVEAMPRDNGTLHFLLRLLNLGLHAHQILQSQQLKEPKLDAAIVTKFVPMLMSLMVDDQIRAVNSKLPPEDRQSEATICPLSESFLKHVREDRLASVLTIYYAEQVAKAKDRQSVVRVYSALARVQSTFVDHHLHILVAGLIGLASEFANEQLAAVVFDEMLLPVLDHNNTTVVMMVMKLLWHVHMHLPVARLDALMLALKQYINDSDIVAQLYLQLQEKINSFGEEDGDATLDTAQQSDSILQQVIVTSVYSARSPISSMSPFYNPQSPFDEPSMDVADDSTDVSSGHSGQEPY